MIDEPSILPIMRFSSMSDATAFEAIKQSYTTDLVPTARQHLTLHALVEQERKTNSPKLAKDERNLAIFDFAIADVKADLGDGVAARIMFSEASDIMKSGKHQGLKAISDSVARKL